MVWYSGHLQGSTRRHQWQLAAETSHTLRVSSTSPRGCLPPSPFTFEDTSPGYTPPAPPLAGSPCNHWYNLYIVNAYTMQKYFIWYFCSDFWGPKLHQISNFRGSAPDPPGSLLRAEASSPSLWLTPPHVNSWIKPAHSDDDRRKLFLRFPRRVRQTCPVDVVRV